MNVSINLGAPQAIMLALGVWNVAYATIHHGQQKTGYGVRKNGWIALIGVSLNLAVLWWGGFFS